MAGGGSRGVGTLAIFGAAILVNLVLTAMLLDQVDRTRSDIRALKGELASKQDLAMFRPLGIEQILEERCTTCHTARRFAAALEMSEPELLTTVAKMSAHAGAAIPAADFGVIKAALTVYRCTTCHDETVVARIGLMPSKQRDRFLRRKVTLPHSGFRADQVEELARAIRVLEGR